MVHPWGTAAKTTRRGFWSAPSPSQVPPPPFTASYLVGHGTLPRTALPPCTGLPRLRSKLWPWDPVSHCHAEMTYSTSLGPSSRARVGSIPMIEGRQAAAASQPTCCANHQGVLR